MSEIYRRFSSPWLCLCLVFMLLQMSCTVLKPDTNAVSYSGWYLVEVATGPLYQEQLTHLPINSIIDNGQNVQQRYLLVITAGSLAEAESIRAAYASAGLATIVKIRPYDRVLQ